ncbi:hypothetical protein P171DRAFT_474140 [Karstenula rhodostoma CBS 690.94]|uniref:MARVEL domain-containing protein n=1 Tax=Karstenula rhodostoma CBS 690.94 TaxID=1392251 RepID=A0A9P4PGW3_9PLEO|nr:hypothetical protein P171DRAFT_474140 [Karstenula rhodostoma CBS 690.94]
MVTWYPRDTRWHGVQKHYFNVSTFKSLVLVVYVVLIIVESSLMRRWFREGNNDLSTTSGPWAFWARTGIYLIIDAAFSLTIAYFIMRNNWHPVAALVTSILLFGLWFAGCVLNAFSVYNNEYYFKQMDEWRGIVYGEAGLQGTIAASYIVMTGFAAKAVHEWRKNKAGMNVKSQADRRVDELVLEERGEAKERVSEGDFVQSGNEGQGRAF